MPDAHTNYQDLIKEHDGLKFENTLNFKPTKTNKLLKQLWEKAAAGPMYNPKKHEERPSEIPVPNSTEEEKCQSNLAVRESQMSNTISLQHRSFDVPSSTSTCTAA